MIALLQGNIAYKSIDHVILDVNGVGYRLLIPLSSYYSLPDDGQARLFVHTHVRDDAILLFGFLTVDEKEMFSILISVSGVGPKLAIAILSGAQVEELAQAIAESNVTRLTAIPGVGRKTAERLVLELKNQITPFLLPEQAESAREGGKLTVLDEDVVSALTNLGYSRSSAEKALSVVIRSAEGERSFEEILRNTLKRLAG